MIDLNNDGLLDLVQSLDTGSPIAGTRWYLNNGTAEQPAFWHLQSADTWYPALPTGEASATSFGDLNNDGRPDMFMVKWKFDSVNLIKSPSTIFVSNRGSPDLRPGRLPATADEIMMNSFFASRDEPGYVALVDL